jgi:ferritin-like metal-binding protein YciE
MKTDELKDVFHTLLCDILNGEKQLVKALPKMADDAENPELVANLQTHQRETEEQVNRLERVFKMLDLPVKTEKCEVMKGLIHEANEITGGCKKGPVRDAAIIASAQKVEHYEIASYGTLVELAKVLGFPEAANILEQTLNEEKGADEKLNVIAMGHVNQEAMRFAA